MTEGIYLDTLTQDSVSLRKQNYVTIEGIDTAMGEPWRKAYVNNTMGREEVSSEIPEPLLSQIMAVWGLTPTIETEPYVEPLPQPPTELELLSKQVIENQGAIDYRVTSVETTQTEIIDTLAVAMGVTL